MAKLTRVARTCAAMCAASLLVACAGTSSAPDSRTALETAQAAGQEIVNEKGEKMICRREAQTGSHTRHKTICMTKEDWQEAAEQARETQRDISRRTPPPHGT